MKSLISIRKKQTKKQIKKGSSLLAIDQTITGLLPNAIVHERFEKVNRKYKKMSKKEKIIKIALMILALFLIGYCIYTGGQLEV